MHVNEVGEFMCNSLTGRYRKQYYYWKCHVEENGVDVHQFSSQSLLLLGNFKNSKFNCATNSFFSLFTYDWLLTRFLKTGSHF